MCRDGICELLRNPGIDFKESNPTAYVAWRPGTTNKASIGKVSTCHTGRRKAKTEERKVAVIAKLSGSGWSKRRSMVFLLFLIPWLETVHQRLLKDFGRSRLWTYK
jgi:hypothetical protein